MRLAVQDGRLPGRSFCEKLDQAEAYGFEGIEPGGWGLSQRIPSTPERRL
ncbi:MAG: hypothetical protein HY706_10805 [Candidatus Hydrogenedentes bacterium]|nr:hypothetical protein [Candidatus Hydrogenedentota bacterium]